MNYREDFMPIPRYLGMLLITLVAWGMPALPRLAMARVPTMQCPAGIRVIPVFPHLKVPENKQTVANYAWPTLQYFPAPAAKANGCAVVICPGGGYAMEWLIGEGYPEAEWLNSLGVAAFVLKYRLPHGNLPPSGVPWPLQDVRRAMQIVRAHAKQWHIDPHRIGVMGFSAGGSVASLAGTHWLPGNPGAADPLNRYSTRPDFLILGYPVISMMPGITHMGSHNNLLGPHAPKIVDEYFSSELSVTVLTPPTFMFYAHDDTAVPHQNEKRFAAALRRSGVPVKLVKFEHGGHGFGLGDPNTDASQWPADCARWLKKMGLLARKR